MQQYFSPKNVLIGLLLIFGAWFVLAHHGIFSKTAVSEPAKEQPTSGNYKTAILAGGCFWSVERDLGKVPGVISVITGYAGGTTENPDYKNYVAGGHREVVEVTYDPTKVTYQNLVESVIKHTDPTDPNGSFFDQGPEYTSAVYFETPEQKIEAETVIKTIDDMKVYPKAIVTEVLPRPTFWPAEEYHQDYAKKHPVGYGAYRNSSGRSLFIQKYWGDNADVFLTKDNAQSNI